MMKNGVIDFHVHAFPDEIAAGAMRKLQEEAPEAKAYLNGTVGDLLGSMERNGIEQSVLCSIATRPEQFDAILRWSKRVQSEKLIVLPSIHPADAKWKERIAQIKAAGFKGVKFHPYYQDFRLDEERMLPLYAELARCDLMAVVHTGYDIAFARDDRADCRRILKVRELFPQLKFVTTHLGAWQQWDEVEQLLLGREIYMEISWALEYLGPERGRQMIMRHPPGYVLFGTDSPWTDQAQTLRLFKQMELPEKLQEQILRYNAERLLGAA